MEQNFRDITRMIENMEKASLNGLTAPRTREPFKMMNNMELEPLPTQMVVYIRASGIMERSMAKEHSLGPMEDSTKETMKMVLDRAMGYTNQVMEQSLKGIGKTENNTEGAGI